jgi:hypothetical protein
MTGQPSTSDMKRAIQRPGLILLFSALLPLPLNETGRCRLGRHANTHGIQPPKVVDGYEQDPIDGVSFAYTFDSPDAPERKTTQYFEIMGSRGIYHEGWMASTFGPKAPWSTDARIARQ